MVRLPEIPIQAWLDDQVNRFTESTSGYFDALEFDLGAQDAESQIPSDYPLPGGPDQWDEAERQNLEAAERRRQEEEEQRRQAQQAQEEAQRRAQIVQEQAQADERRARAEASAMSTASELGIPTPDQAFSSFLGMAQRPRDNLSSILFDRDNPATFPASNNGVITNSPETASNPVSDFMNWASSYTGASPTPNPASPDGEPPRDNTSSVAFSEPAPARERGYFEPTETERSRVSEAWEGTKNAEPVGPEFLPGAVRQGLGYGLGALETAEAVTDPVRARLDPRVWAFARNGVMAEKLPDEFARMNDLMGTARPDGSQRLELTPEEQQELRRLEQLRETLYQGIKDDPDALTKYAESDPAYHLTTAVTDTAMIPAAGGVARGLASGGARALGAGARTAERAGYVADVAAQSALDPTNLITGPGIDAAVQGVGAARRGARSLYNEAAYRTMFGGADEAAEAVEQTPGVVRRGSGVVPEDDFEVPNPFPLTPEEQALNAAADARARAAPRHSGYLEDPSYGADDERLLGSGVVPEGTRPPERFYHGTSGAFGRPDPDRFDPNGLYGPGYYMTSDPRVAGSYAQTRAGPTVLDNPYLGWENERLQEAITRTQRTLEDPALDVATSNEIMDDLELMEEALTGYVRTGPSSGPNVRAIDVPYDLNVLDLEAPVPLDRAQQVIDAVRRQGLTPVADELQQVLDNKVAGLREFGIYNPQRVYQRGEDLWDDVRAELAEAADQFDFGDVQSRTNQILHAAGYDGLTHLGGQRVPMLDDAGRRIEHDVTIVFPESLDKITNAFSGEAGGSGFIPNAARGLRAPAFNAAQGGVFGAATENLEAQQEGREVDYGEQLRRTVVGAGLGGLAGTRAARSLGRRVLGSGVVPDAADDAGPFNLLEMVEAIRGMRRAKYTDDMVLSAEKYLAENTSLTLDAVQGLTRAAGKVTEAELRAAGMVLPEAVEPWSMPRQHPQPQPYSPVSPPPTVTPMAPIPNSTYTPPGPPVTSASANTPQLPKAGTVQGTPEGVKQAAENRRLIQEQHEQNLRKPKPVSDKDMDYILGELQKVKSGFSDRHARLSAITRYLENKQQAPLTPEQNAWMQARLYPGNRQAAQDMQQKIIQPALSAVKPEHQSLVSSTMKQLDALDIDNNLGDKVQREALNTLPEGRAPVDEVRRQGEATLEAQRARANLNATEREYVKARADRDALLQEMEQAGEGPTRAKGSVTRGRKGIPGGPLPEAAMETERFTRRADQLEKANIRVEQARVRRDDASRIVNKAIQQSQIKRTDAKLERAAIRAEDVRSRRKYTAGITPVSRDDIIDDLTQAIGQEDANKVLDAIQATFKARDLTRDMLYREGLISQDDLNYLVTNYPHYSPIRFLDHMNQADRPEFVGKTFAVGSSPIKKLTEGGSDLESMDSVQATSEMISRAYDMVARNKVMQAVEEWTSDPALQELVRPIKEAKDLPNLQDWKAMPFWRGGEKQLLAVRNELAESLDLASPAIPKFAGKVFRFLSGHARTAFTVANPEFLAGNAVLDAINYMHREMVNAPGLFGVGKESNPLRVGADLLEGYWASLGSRNLATRAGAGAWAGAQAQATATSREQEDDPYYWHKIGAAGLLGAGAGAGIRATKGQRALMERMSKAGATIGQRSRFTKPEDVVRQLRGENIVVRTLSDDPGMLGRFKRAGEKISDLGGLIWDRPLAEIGAISEAAPRIAAFKRAERQGKSAEEAAMAARRISVDFDAGGTWSKQINDIIPFFNARVQGLVETADDFKKHPYKSAAALSGIIGSLIALNIYNRNVAPEAYKDVSEYTKHHGAVVMSDKPPEGKGKWELAFLPLRGTSGLMVPLVDEMMSAAYGDDPKTWQELARKVGISTFNQISPVPFDPEELSSMAMLPVLGPTVGAMANYDWFRGEPIVSRSQQTLPITEQYTDRTSQTARHVGRALGWSPTKIDWWVKNTFGGPGKQLTSLTDAVLHKAGADLPTTERDIPKGARDVPFFGPIAGRFLRTVGSERQNKAYERAEAVVAKLTPQMVADLEADPAYQAATPDKQKQLLRGAQTELEDRAREMAGVPAFVEPKDLGLPPRFQGVEVGSPLEQEILKALATPEQYRTQRQHNLAFQYKTSDSQYLDISRRQRRESERLRQNVGDLVTGQSVR